MLKVAFPFSFSDTVATYEIPYGSIQRSTQRITKWQKARFEVPAEKWADMTSGNYGVSLLNNSKYGYDIKDNVMRLSLLRSPKWPDPTQDMGKHKIDYALYPHEGSWQEANVVRRGWEYNEPLIAVLNDVHDGDLPLSDFFIKLNEGNLILTTVKKAEGSEAWIYQWYESEGKETEATLILPKTPQKIVESNFIEENGNPISFNGNIVKIRTKRNSVFTVKVYY